MNYINFRIALAYLIPGFIPLMFCALLIKDPVYKIGSFTTEGFTIFILAGVTAGLLIDLFKQQFEKAFILWCNLTVFKVLFKKIFRVDESIRPNWTLKQQFQDYEDKLQETIKFWISIQIDKKQLNDQIEKNPKIKKEYYDSLITTGDRWALLNILEKDALNYIINEYYTYYQFSFNTFLSISLTTIISCLLFFNGMISHHAFWLTLPVLLLLILFLQGRAIFWLLATRRFSRKIILYSILKD